jgi:CRP/FNR family transcriptional regulator, cyclic AMP receptor protein
LLAVIEPVTWFGEIALFDNRARTHDAYAERDAELFHVPRAALAALLERMPAWWHVFGLLLTQKLRLAFDAIEEAALLPAAQRVARRLLLMAGGYGEPGALRRVLKVPQEDLAMMLALSRQTINQVLKQFETQGALKLGYAEIEIADVGKLGALADLEIAGPLSSPR